MKAVILAGGAGTRLRDIIADVPKPMAEVSGKPFLEYLVLQLLRNGISEVIISIGYKGDVIESYFGSGEKWNAKITYSMEDTPLGTGGGMKKAAPLIEDDSFLVMNGDSFLDLNIKEFSSYHKKKKAIATIGLASLDDTGRYGKVEINERNEVVSFVEKKANGQGLINGGVYLFNREIIDRIPDGKVSLETEVLPALINHGLYGMVVNGYFIDIGLPQDYLHLLSLSGGNISEPAILSDSKIKAG
ncbi:MAG TPA: nucleotidyltransferase family protein [bacterium]